MSRPPFTPKQLADKVAEARDSGDIEEAHAEMDRVLCEALRRLGYDEAVRIFREADKWYA